MGTPPRAMPIIISAVTVKLTGFNVWRFPLSAQGQGIRESLAASSLWTARGAVSLAVSAPTFPDVQ